MHVIVSILIAGKYCVLDNTSMGSSLVQILFLCATLRHGEAL